MLSDRPIYLYQREIQPSGPVSLERSDYEEQQKDSGQHDEEEAQSSDKELNNMSFPDDETACNDNADFLLGRVSRFGRSIHLNRRNVFR